MINAATKDNYPDARALARRVTKLESEAEIARRLAGFEKRGTEPRADIQVHLL